LASVSETPVVGDHDQPPYPRKPRNEIVDDPIDKILLTVIAHVVEGKNGD
jgi:hypothetical protein